MKKLITMTEYVLERDKFWTSKRNDKSISSYDGVKGFVFNVVDYAQLLQTPLELGQFIPCKDGEPMEKPEKWRSYTPNTLNLSADAYRECVDYQKALDSVLFEGWEINGAGEIVKGNFEAQFQELTGTTWLEWVDFGAHTAHTIEDLITSGIELNPILTLINRLT